MDEPRTATREARFEPEAVRRLLERAEVTGAGIDLVKDEGAYLMTWEADGQPASDVIVYADGHQPPPRSQPANFTPDDPWVVARAATESVWGGDDFGYSFTPAEVRAALGPAGLVVRTSLTVVDLPDEYPASPWGRRDPLHTLEQLEMLKAEV